MATLAHTINLLTDGSLTSQNLLFLFHKTAIKGAFYGPNSDPIGAFFGPINSNPLEEFQEP